MKKCFANNNNDARLNEMMHHQVGQLQAAG